MNDISVLLQYCLTCFPALQVLVLTVSALFCFELFNQGWSTAEVTRSSWQKAWDDYQAAYVANLQAAGLYPIASPMPPPDMPDMPDMNAAPPIFDDTISYDGNTTGDTADYSNEFNEDGSYNYDASYDYTTDEVELSPYVSQAIVYPLQTLFVRSILKWNKAGKFALRMFPWLYTIMVAILVGFFSWQSQVANFSTPTCVHYRTQVSLSPGDLYAEPRRPYMQLCYRSC